MGSTVVFDQTLTEVEAGELPIPAGGRAGYVLAVNASAGADVTVVLEDRRSLGAGRSVTSVKVSAGDVESASGSTGAWPELWLVWDGPLTAAVTVTASR